MEGSPDTCSVQESSLKRLSFGRSRFSAQVIGKRRVENGEEEKDTREGQIVHTFQTPSSVSKRDVEKTGTKMEV